jgi:GNAT superfamily N-acetyltransferase
MQTTHECLHAGYLISDDSRRLDIDAIQGYLTTSYWAEGIPREVVARCVESSLCFGIYAESGQQVGLVRVISDYTTFAYLCDVYVLEPHRGRGLATAAVGFAMAHPRLQNLRRWHLVTRDAHPIYAPFGFEPVAQPERHMEKRNPDVYRRKSG